MMRIFESLFDIGYLGLVIGMGIRLLLEENKKAKLLGVMAILLGLGDAFHLIPRVVSHLMENGFENNIVYLSWGEFVTSITMTIFYVLFYYYYRDISKDDDRKKEILVYILAGLRILLVLMPQNQWGTKGGYIFGIIRNVPFLILGLALIYWAFKHKDKEGLKNSYLLIALSFLFYIPVVVGARFIPILGVLMIPKTVAYVLLVVEGYRHFIKEFNKDSILKQSITFLVLGLFAGVFYREFTKIYGFTGPTSLSVVHVHLIALGFLFLLLIYSIVKNEKYNLVSIKSPFMLYSIGLSWTVTVFFVRGIYTVTSNGIVLFSDAALSGMAGLGHVILGFSIIFVMIRILKLEREKGDRKFKKIKTTPVEDVEETSRKLIAKK